MKKFLSIITSAILVASLDGCGGATNSADGSNTVNQYNITIGIDLGQDSDKMFEALATIDAGSISRTKNGMYF